MRLNYKVIAVLIYIVMAWSLIIFFVTGCAYWHQPGVKIEIVKKDCKLAAEKDDFEYQMFLWSYEKTNNLPKGIDKEWFIYKGRLIGVAGE